MNAEDSTRLLEAQRLSFCVGTRRILDDVSLSVYAGQFVVLVGPNGAGKTTLLEALAGVLRVSDGTVSLAERPLGSYTARQRAHLLALLGREATGELTLSVQTVVELGRLPHLRGISLTDRDHGIVESCLQQTDTTGLRQRFLYSLSDGERQRVHWARALCQQPRLLLLDEATSHLDLAHRELSFRRAHAFARDGGGVLAVAHDLDLALRHADRIIVLCAGRIYEDGPPASALTPRTFDEVFGVDAEIIDTSRGRSLAIYGARS